MLVEYKNNLRKIPWVFKTQGIPWVTLSNHIYANFTGGFHHRVPAPGEAVQ